MPIEPGLRYRFRSAPSKPTTAPPLRTMGRPGEWIVFRLVPLSQQKIAKKKPSKSRVTRWFRPQSNFATRIDRSSSCKASRGCSAEAKIKSSLGIAGLNSADGDNGKRHCNAGKERCRFHGLEAMGCRRASPPTGRW